MFAGTIGLRNASRRPLRVGLAPVVGQTLDTLGSAYAVPGQRARRGPATWLLVPGQATLAPGASVALPVWVSVPPAARPGDYLAGVSVEALGQEAESLRRRGVAIASAVRYAVGVEVSLPGPRRPAIRFAGASVEREPARLTFLLAATNTGNAILQGVRGSALVTREGRVVAHLALGPGTFVTGSSIAYPVPAPGEHPSEGTVYGVRAILSYPGGVATLDTHVRFGHAQALRQQAYSPQPGASSGGLSPLLVALLAVGACSALAAFPLARHLIARAGMGTPGRTLRAALASSRATGEPLSAIVISPSGEGGETGGDARASALIPLVRSRLRHADALCRLDRDSVAVLARDTDTATAQALAEDLRRHVSRACPVRVEVHDLSDAAGAAEALERIRPNDPRATPRMV